MFPLQASLWWGRRTPPGQLSQPSPTSCSGWNKITQPCYFPHSCPLFRNKISQTLYLHAHCFRTKFPNPFTSMLIVFEQNFPTLQLRLCPLFRTKFPNPFTSLMLIVLEQNLDPQSVYRIRIESQRMSLMPIKTPYWYGTGVVRIRNKCTDLIG